MELKGVVDSNGRGNLVSDCNGGASVVDFEELVVRGDGVDWDMGLRAGDFEDDCGAEVGGWGDVDG